MFFPVPKRENVQRKMGEVRRFSLFSGMRAIFHARSDEGANALNEEDAFSHCE